MILRPSDPPPSPAPDAPRVGFACLHSAGPDPRRDAAFALELLAWCPQAGAWQRELRPLRPRADARPPSAERLKLAGVDPAELASAPDPEQVLAEVIAHRDPGFELLLVDRRQAFHAFAARHWPGGRALPQVVGLDELGRWLLPAGHGPDPARTLARGLSRGDDDQPAAALGAREVQRVAAALVEAFQSRPTLELGLVGRAWSEAQARLEGKRPAIAADLGRLAAFVDHPSGWERAGESLFQSGGRLRDGVLGEATARIADVELALDEVFPGWTEREREPGNLPPKKDGTRPLSSKELALLDAVFREHLPALSGGARAQHRELGFRPAQAEVANAVARSLGRGQLLLLHAPTGTGKTLAYLLPSLLFAQANGLRMGVATYTRALQRQAYERDLPLALAALERAGVEELPRASLLKGRANYLCWRGLVAHTPLPDDGAERWLAFAHLLSFALASTDGDLEQLPRDGFLPLDLGDTAGRELGDLLRQSAARSGCCTKSGDRGLCGADAARKRAERSHVVLTNQAFALARQEFLRHVVFDECEHLHDQAHNAFSHVVSFGEIQKLLEHLGEAPRRGAKRKRSTTLERLRKAAPPGSSAHDHVGRAFGARTNGLLSLAAMEQAAKRFVTWREGELRQRGDRDAYGLLVERVRAGEADDLVQAHADLVAALTGLESAIAALLELLIEIPMRGRERARTRLERLKGDLAEISGDVDAFLPRHEGEVRFDRGTFYDVEPHPRRGLVLMARVLLPNEHLGRYYYPDLDGAVLLSATTRLGNKGFDAASAYLGLDRAATPAEDEAREPSEVTTFASPEAFDYGRVVALVPKDAPDVGGDKRRWLEYAARYIGHLAECGGGGVLGLFTNAEDVAFLAERLEPFLEARGLVCLAQGRPGTTTEQLFTRFRSEPGAVLLGLDSFWFGADFPGPACTHVVIGRLPYGVPDRYHFAQGAALGSGEHWRRIYRPRALSRFRQGFGRLMRRHDDRGCVHLLDRRVVQPKHRTFLSVLPLAEAGSDAVGARLVRADSVECIAAAFEHLDLRSDLERRGLWRAFEIDAGMPAAPARPPVPPVNPGPAEESGPLAIDPGDVPF